MFEKSELLYDDEKRQEFLSQYFKLSVHLESTDFKLIKPIYKITFAPDFSNESVVLDDLSESEVHLFFDAVCQLKVALDTHDQGSHYAAFSKMLQLWDQKPVDDTDDLFNNLDSRLVNDSVDSKSESNDFDDNDDFEFDDDALISNDNNNEIKSQAVDDILTDGEESFDDQDITMSDNSEISSNAAVNNDDNFFDLSDSASNVDDVDDDVFAHLDPNLDSNADNSTFNPNDFIAHKVDDSSGSSDSTSFKPKEAENKDQFFGSSPVPSSLDRQNADRFFHTSNVQASVLEPSFNDRLTFLREFMNVPNYVHASDLKEVYDDFKYFKNYLSEHPLFARYFKFGGKIRFVQNELKLYDRHHHYSETDAFQRIHDLLHDYVFLFKQGVNTSLLSEYYQSEDLNYIGMLMKLVRSLNYDLEDPLISVSNNYVYLTLTLRREIRCSIDKNKFKIKVNKSARILGSDIFNDIGYDNDWSITEISVADNQYDQNKFDQVVNALSKHGFAKK